MHISDGFLNNNLAIGLLVGAFAMFGYCLDKVFGNAVVFVENLVLNNGNAGIELYSLEGFDNTNKYFQKLANIAIWIFALQMFNVPIKPATSAHLIGGVFASVITDPFSGFIIISSILMLQSLFFSDGGILALGANIFNMAFIGSFLSYYVYKVLSNKNYYFAIFGACCFSILVASLSCIIELTIFNTLSFIAIFEDMMSLHLIIVLLETILTLILIKTFNNLSEIQKNKRTIIFIAVPIVIVSLASFFASNNPDTLKRLAIKYNFINQSKEMISLFKGYCFPFINNYFFSTLCAGITGITFIYITYKIINNIVNALRNNLKNK
ncbi:MAG: energy-coupling factor ABC transporter permease [Endomicrobium sp.]|jgi:cobalt/nickel transport system permease protein|nr:energy-coupling factor ABC transporter permease [Endomicrobium sp.]